MSSSIFPQITLVLLGFPPGVTSCSLLCIHKHISCLERIQFHLKRTHPSIFRRALCSLLFHRPCFSSVQSLSHVQLFATPWTAALQASLSFTISQSLLREQTVHQVGDAIQPSHPLLSPSPPAFNLSQHQGLFQ